MKGGHTVVKRVRKSMILSVAIILVGCGDSDVVRPDVDASNACVDYGNTMHWSGPAYTGYRGVVVPGVSVYPGYGGYFLTDVSQGGQINFVAFGRGAHAAVAGHFAYWAGWGEFKVLDVSAPSSPIELATLELGPIVGDVAISGSFVYLTLQVEDDSGSSQVGLRIVDISDPHAPSLVGSTIWDAPGVCFYEFGSAVTIVDSHAYVAAGDFLHIIDVSNLAAPAVASRLAVSANGVVVVGNYAYVVGNAGLHVIDVSVPHAPALVGTVAEGNGGSVTVQGARAYVIDDGSLKAFDLPEESSPQPLATIELWSGAFDMVLAGSHAFVTSSSLTECYEGPRGLQVVDLPDGDEARALGRVRSDGTVIGSHGAFAYTVTGWEGMEEPFFRVIDASSARTPRVVGRVAFGHNPNAVVVDGSRAYIATDAGLETIDASVPTAPKFASLLAMAGGVRDLQVHRDHVYLIGESHITIVDVSSVSNPMVVGSLEKPRYANRVLVGDNQLIVGAVNDYHYDVPLTVFDISRPTHPLVAFEHPDWCWELRDMAVRESYLCTLYSHEEDRTLNVYDISARAAPIHIGEVELYSSWEIASISGRRVFLADGTIVDFSGPGAFKLLGKMPSAGYPFEGTSGLYVAADGFFQVFPSPCR